MLALVRLPQICLEMARHGVLAKPTHDHIIRLAPPLTMNDDQLEDCMGRISSAIRQVQSRPL